MRVRFAPSPTGEIHVGNVRTALFNYLLAKKHGGAFVLRIEDTDIERSDKKYEEIIFEVMRWLGLDWDEGAELGGEFGPYRQTARFNTYEAATRKLLEEGHAYYCFCSKEELEANRVSALSADKAPLYSGKCRRIPPEEAKARVAAGEKAAVRFKVQKPAVTVRDLVHGEVNFPTDSFGDFIIVRPDGAPLYNYAVVVDDALMKITLVIRGDDHLSNTPKQALIFEALGCAVPDFAHIPMILGPDRAKLSKRHGTTSVIEFKRQGYLPEAMLNYMALLSWSDAGGEQELFTKEELIEKFSLERVSKSPAVFDFGKLKWMNGLYIRKADISRLTELCVPYLAEAGFIGEDYDRERLSKIVSSVRDNLEVLGDISEYAKLYFEKELPAPEEDALEILRLPTTKGVLEGFKAALKNVEEPLALEEYKAIMKSIQKSTGTKGKPLYMAVRVALTVRTKGPELDHFVPLMPQKTVLERITVRLANI